LTEPGAPQTVQLELKPVLSLDDIPSGIALHGTTVAAWKIIGSFQPLSLQISAT